MDVCVVRHEGELLLPRHMPAAPPPFLKSIAASRDGLVVAVACLFTWYWLAALCPQAGIPFVLGHALSLKAIHGGKATNDTIDAQQIAAVLRGGRLPQASVSPAEMRATRARFRRRPPLMRTRADLLAHGHKTPAQDNWPEIGKHIADKANRQGVAARCNAPAGPKTIEGDLALLP